MRDRSHRGWMLRAAALGRRGQGWTSPNPPVGALVVREGEVVGRGFHQRAGLPHAEVLALAEAGQRAVGATLYVTLEPCAHHGRTPPCVDAIVASGVRRVVAGTRDPNPLVNGKGFARLREAGVEVVEGVASAVCRRLIEPYATAITRGRPYVALKLAMSADGRIAPPKGSARWITGPPARRLVHRLRAQVDAVLVGVGTVLTDDPSLDARIPRAHQPRPVVLDSCARLPLASRVMGRSPLGVCGPAADHQRVAALEERGATVVRVGCDERGLCIPEILTALQGHAIQSILVEGGSRVAASFLAAAAVDRAYLFFSPCFLGSRGVPAVADLGLLDLASAPRGTLTGLRRVGGDGVMEVWLGPCSRD